MGLCSGSEGLLAWNDNWVTFLDALLQMKLYEEAGRDLRLPTRIRSLRVDPIRHARFVNTLDDGRRGIVRATDVVFF